VILLDVSEYTVHVDSFLGLIVVEPNLPDTVCFIALLAAVSSFTTILMLKIWGKI
jgi:hypothetical protein